MKFLHHPLLLQVRPGEGFVPMFDLTSRIDVNGKNTDPMWKWLKEGCGYTQDGISSGTFYE